MDHSRLHKASIKKINAEIKAGQKIKRRSLVQRERRNDVLRKQRDLSPVKENKQGITRRERLETWKKGKEIQKQKEKKNAKPIFKVCRVKGDDNLLLPIENRWNAGPARNTRSKTGVVKGAAISRVATQKKKNKVANSLNPAKLKKTLNKREDKENQPNEPTKSEGDEPAIKVQNLEVQSDKQAMKGKVPDSTLSESFAPADFTFKAPLGLRKLQLNMTIPNSIDSFVAREDVMNFISSTPCMSQLAAKMKPMPAPMVLSSDNCSSSGEEHGNQAVKEPDNIREDEKVGYFRQLVVTETNSLKANCTKWEKIQERSDMTLIEDVVGEIRSVIGQAQLLMTERFVQFESLIDKYENPKPDHNPVTPTDLKGFWEMIYFQVEDVAKKFQSLDKLKDNDWQREEAKTKVVRRKKKAPKAAKGSSAHRRAARQRVKEAREAMHARLKASNNDDITDTEEAKDQNSAEATLNREDGVARRSLRKTPRAVSSVTPRKERKARFAVDNNPGDGRTTPTGSQPRKRVMRKTPLPGSGPESIREEPYICNIDVRASPMFKKEPNFDSESLLLESGENPASNEMKGIKLEFDDVQSDQEDDLGFAEKYLVSTAVDLDKKEKGGIDLKYLMPNPPLADSSEGTLLTETLESPRVLRSQRKSRINPFSPFIKSSTSVGQVTAEPNGAVADDLMSFSPLPAK